MADLSVFYQSLFNIKDPDVINETLKELVGVLNLKELEELRKKLDDHQRL